MLNISTDLVIFSSIHLLIEYLLKKVGNSKATDLSNLLAYCYKLII